MSKLTGYLPALVWAIIIFYLSGVHSLRIAQNPGWDEVLRSLAHVFFYFVLMILILLAPKFGGLKSEKNHLRTAIILGLGYALFDEYHQSLVPTRDASFLDLGLDSLGILIGLLLFKQNGKFYEKIHKNI